jgi:glutamyl-tRNA reductase
MELGQREKKLLKKVLNASLQRLLREPIRELKHLDTEEEQEEYRRLIRHLFQI